MSDSRQFKLSATDRVMIALACCYLIASGFIIGMWVGRNMMEVQP